MASGDQTQGAAVRVCLLSPRLGGLGGRAEPPGCRHGGAVRGRTGDRGGTRNVFESRVDRLGLDMGGALSSGTWDCMTAPYSAAAFSIAVPMDEWGSVPAIRTPSRVIREAAPNRDSMEAAQLAALKDIVGWPA